jgi:hypothetical protein
MAGSYMPVQLCFLPAQSQTVPMSATCLHGSHKHRWALSNGLSCLCKHTCDFSHGSSIGAPTMTVKMH